MELYYSVRQTSNKTILVINRGVEKYIFQFLQWLMRLVIGGGDPIAVPKTW